MRSPEEQVVHEDGRGLSLMSTEKDNREAPLLPSHSYGLSVTPQEPGDVSPPLYQAKGFLNLLSEPGLVPCHGGRSGSLSRSKVPPR